MSDRVTTTESALKTANSLFVDENYQEALVNYNLSIELDDKNVEALLKRAACLQKLGRLTDALNDVKIAIQFKPADSTLSKLYMRKGLICFEMEEFETAKISFEKGFQLDPSNNSFRTWIRKCNAELEVEEDAMDIVTPHTSTSATHQNPIPSNPSSTPTSTTTSTSTSTPTSTTAAPTEQKIRHEWYQTATHVFVTVFVKNIKQEQLNVQIEEKSLNIAIKLSPTNEFALDFDLCDKVLKDESTTTLMSTKVEIKLKKATQTRWKTLEDKGEGVGTQQWDNINTQAKPQAKNWDKIVNEVTAGEKLDGEESLNKVFQDIYANGTDEQKKAMMKSFTESGGTVLSTNWDEVGKKHVKGTPPDGLEMHKWEEMETGNAPKQSTSPYDDSDSDSD